MRTNLNKKVDKEGLELSELEIGCVYTGDGWEGYFVVFELVSSPVAGNICFLDIEENAIFFNDLDRYGLFQYVGKAEEITVLTK
jgi:hypothetical protein